LRGSSRDIYTIEDLKQHKTEAGIKAAGKAAVRRQGVCDEGWGHPRILLQRMMRPPHDTRRQQDEPRHALGFVLGCILERRESNPDLLNAIHRHPLDHRPGAS